MKKINYNARDFAAIESELLNFVKQYYPELFNDFNDASVGKMLLDLNAAVADMLSFNTDRSFQETQLEFAQERKNILQHAKTLGFNIPYKKPSITIVDFTVEVPPFGDSFDIEYLPIIKTGAQVTGGGKIFETIDDIDFASPLSNLGVKNRIIKPNTDSNDVIRSYTITKREMVVNGRTNIYKKVITSQDNKPFLEIFLPEQDVVSIEQVICLEGTNYVNTPQLEEFFNNAKRFFEVENLAQDKIFIEDKNKTSGTGIKYGKYLDITKKFVKEFTEKGFCKLIFGGGNSINETFNQFISQLGNVPVSNFLNNDALGEIPKANSTLYIRYRVGGGSSSNVGANTLKGLGNVDIMINGNRNDYNNMVKNSLRVNNLIPALGGADEPSIEQIRKLISYNFSAQNRCVTTRDYLTQIHKMHGRFGSPYRVNAYEEDNKVVISILTLNELGKLENRSTSVLKENIAEYLSDYKMLNDFIEIIDGKIFNLGFEVDVLIDKTFSDSEVAANVILAVDDYMAISKHIMNEDIYLSELIEKINNINGILNVIDIRIFNKVGGDYGVNEISQAYSDSTTKQIKLIDYTIFGEPNSMFQVYNPNKDIKVRIKK